MAVMTRIFNKSRRLRDVFGLVPVSVASTKDFKSHNLLQLPLLVAVTLIVLVSVLSVNLEQRQEKYPERESFASFPTAMGDWQGQRTAMQSIYLNALKLTDYLMIDFLSSANERVNVYSAYYQSQREGATIHSPRSCIPGDGWRIDSLEKTSLPGSGGGTLEVNRAQIAKGTNKQLVYYWFEQRGRTLTNEYLVKWYLFWDALTLQRTDGALIRITTSLKPGETWQDAEKRLQFIAQFVEGTMGRYIPGR
jgi:EpsI family protein